ncbi:hypothetical protein [Micavibrio aeruginosavorus]|uniref:hypothetical protein n=1 Tax=Micavibrio aeruginosavorus TaxID=349221 RepID=UPI003F4A9886
MLSPETNARYDGPIPHPLRTCAAPPALYGPPPALAADLFDTLTRLRQLRRTNLSDQPLKTLYARIAALHARLVRLKSWDVF